MAPASTEFTDAVSANSGHGEAEPEGYRELVNQALRERAAGYPEKAQIFLEKAHAIFPNARTLRGLGVVAVDLKLYRKAAQQLHAALDSQVRPLDESLRTATTKLLEQVEAHLGRVRLEVEPSWARVRVDGAIESSPGAFDVVAGAHELWLEADGYLVEKRLIRLEPGSELAIPVVLQRVPPLPPRHSERRHRELWRNPWLWSAVAVVVVGGVVGVAIAASRGPEYERGTSDMLVGGTQ